MPTQPLGWFKKPITKADDFKGLKFRTVGISIDVFTGLGAAVNALPGGEIVPAMDRGLLDAAEFNNATSDRILGFADVSKVCMLQSYHQNAEQFEITFNKTKFDALPDKMKAIIENAVEAASADMSWKAVDRYSKDYVELQTKDKVRFYKTPDSVLQKQLEIYDTVADKKAADNPLFKEIAESQKAFAARAVKWDLDTNVSRRMAYNHYFGKPAAKKSQSPRDRPSAGQPSGRRRMAGLCPADERQPLIRAVDLVSYWSGKAFAWLIVALTFVVSIEVFKRYILNAPTAWIFDFNNMLYGTLFMMCGAYTLAAAGHVRADFVYSYLKPARPGRARSGALPPVLHPRHPGPDLRRLRLRRALLADRRALDGDRRGPARLPLQDGHPGRRRAGDAPGAGRDRALHRVPAHRRLAAAPRGRRGDRRHRHPARPQRVRRRGVAPRGHGGRPRDRGGGPPPQRHGGGRRARAGDARGPDAVSDPSSASSMLGLIVVAIMMGFPTAFTLMGLGMVFGFWPSGPRASTGGENRVFDLIVQRTYGVMTNDTLLSVPLFVFMGYIMERAALVDRMFHSVQLAFRRVPASLAVTTLLVCAFWGIASGIVGAVVVLMGVIAMRRC